MINVKLDKKAKEVISKTADFNAGSVNNIVSGFDGMKIANDMQDAYYNYKLTTYNENKEEIETWIEEDDYNTWICGYNILKTFDEFKEEFKNLLAKYVDIKKPLITYFYTEFSGWGLNLPFEFNFKIKRTPQAYNLLEEVDFFQFKLETLGDNNTFASFYAHESTSNNGYRFGALTVENFRKEGIQNTFEILTNYTLENIIDMMWSEYTAQTSGQVAVSNYESIQFATSEFFGNGYFIPYIEITIPTVDENILPQVCIQLSKTNYYYLTSEDILKFIEFSNELRHDEPVM